MARPTDASLDDPAVVDDLCARISSGEGISEACSHAGTPSERAVYLRMASDAEFCGRIARAREAQQDSEADKIVALADAATVEDHQVVRLRIDARKWRAAKLAPKKYGEKVTNELVGDPARPVAITVLSGVPRPDDGS